jgi:hypothetical protein
MNQAPYRPEVILNPQAPQRPPNALGVPDFTDLAAGIDGMARRIPWWVWLAGGATLMWYLSRGRSRTIKL